ncbi:MAG: glycine betaine ABC transporter substrate-binding protein [Pseudomonadota bacterium]
MRALRRMLAVLVLLGAAGTATAAEREPIRIGWTAWSDAEFTSTLVARLVEQRLGRPVERVLVDIALQYQGVSDGELDAMVMAWLPDTHRDYYQRFAGRFVDLGPIYTGARLGWVVPAYVPAEVLGSIEDLNDPEVARRLRRQIYGIDPGAGLMRLSDEAVAAYGLEAYNLIASSGAAMTAMMERAIRREQWIVATAWSPHWMFHRWELRYLEDPRGVLGGRERVHALARKGFYRDAPEVFELLGRLYLPLKELEAAIAEARETSYAEAVDRYVRTHPERVHYWLTGELKRAPTHEDTDDD